MCLICIDFQKQKMTTRDARRALREMREGMDEEHIEEVTHMIAEAEREERAQKKKSEPPKQP